MDAGEELSRLQRLLDLRVAVLEAWANNADDFEKKLAASGIGAVRKDVTWTAKELANQIESLTGTTEQEVKGNLERWAAYIELPRNLAAATKTLVQMVRAALKRQEQAESRKRKKESAAKAQPKKKARLEARIAKPMRGRVQ